MPGAMHLLVIHDMTKIFRLFTLAFLLLCLGACDINFNTDSRSGTIEKDYVAEPLSSTSSKYENALLVSNLFIDHLKDGRVDSIYTNLFSAELRKIVPKKEFQQLLNQLTAAKGSVTRYKKMQWGFISGEENGRSFIGSVKLVEHENGMMKYLIVFDDDGKFEEIAGFRFKERDGVSPPGQF